MENKTKEQILNTNFNLPVFRLLNPVIVDKIFASMDEYSDQNCNKIQELFSKPAKQLKPLEDLYRKENPRPDGKFYVPDATKFYEWIRIKILGK